MNYSVILKRKLYRLIKTQSRNRDEFVSNPAKDFTRKRELDYETMIKIILSAGSGSTRKELLTFYNYKKFISNSAFCQQRAKIRSAAFKDLFYSFNKLIPKSARYRGFLLLACDGSVIRTPMPNSDAKCHFQGNYTEYNRHAYLHLNALYDLCNCCYIDAMLEPERTHNEKEALIRMLYRQNNNEKSIYIVDRGYESYNLMAHLCHAGQYFVMRIKDFHKGGFAQNFLRPAEEFDQSYTRIFTRQMKREYLEKQDVYISIRHKYNLDFFTPEHDMFQMTFRILRFKISEDTYECIATNLPAADFTMEDIKELYGMRWGIETSFRELKYAAKLLYFHSKKEEFIIQEIYAKLLMYNFSQAVIAHMKLEEAYRKYTYQVNQTLAQILCTEFLKLKTPINVEYILEQSLLPLRPNRSFYRAHQRDYGINLLYRT